MLLRALSKCLLNADRHGASATSLRSLFQGLTTLTVKEFFLMSSLILPWVCAVPTSPVTGDQGAEANTSLCTSPPQEAAENSEVTSQPPFLQTRQPMCHEICLLAITIFQLLPFLLPSSGHIQVS